MNLGCFTPWSLVQYDLGHYAANSSLNVCSKYLNLKQQSTPFDLGSYLKVFGLTYLLELPFYGSYLYFQKKSLPAILGFNFILNLATHPLVYFFWPWLMKLLSARYYQTLNVAEIFAISIEALLLYLLVRPSFSKSFGVSLAANLFSWTVGLYLLH